MSFWVTVKDLDLVWNFQFFQEPENTLRAGLFKPGFSISIVHVKVADPYQ